MTYADTIRAKERERARRKDHPDYVPVPPREVFDWQPLTTLLVRPDDEQKILAYRQFKSLVE